MAQFPINRFSAYVLVNICFAMLVGIMSGVGGYPNPRLLHLILLFALCSSPVIDSAELNGPFALLGLFMVVYFVSYGVGDLSNLLTGVDAAGVVPSPRAREALSKPEAVILVGGLMLTLGYRLSAWALNTNRPIRRPRDWPKSAIILVGAFFWVVGTVATYRWNVYVVPDTTNEAFRRGLASISSASATIYMLGQMCQPLGILLLAYALCVFRDRYLIVVVIAMVVLQLFIGFVVDIKGLAMLGMILVSVTSVLVTGRLPKIWIAAGVLFVIFIFPIFQAYRSTIHGGRGLSRTTVVENFSEVLQLTIAAKDQVNSGKNRAQTFLERASVKGSVETIVNNTGNGVNFQQGHTLLPILSTFMPRILWAEKRGVPTGQLLNRQFHITESDDIWISPSHLGELYWNYGWGGVVLGMWVIGLVCGWVGARFSSERFATVTRVMVTVVTIKQLIVGFEGGISDIYVVWLRSLAGIGILHLIFARVSVGSRDLPSQDERPQTEPVAAIQLGRQFPHLLA